MKERFSENEKKEGSGKKNEKRGKSVNVKENESEKERGRESVTEGDEADPIAEVHAAETEDEVVVGIDTVAGTGMS